ncbi:MAG: NTP transferase domain-containing protein [Planctomycetes bacterium]|nr:NTP transferase domain-containing protein [Planctomycetota bacterium]
MTAAVPFSLAPLAPEAVLAADLPLAEAVAHAVRRPEPVLALRAERGFSAVLEDDLRVAWQDGVPATTPIAALARRGLLAATEAEARRSLDLEPSWPGVLVAGAEAPAPRVLLRGVAPIRTAIVMAGGRGQRLRPLTERTPKPMLAVGGRPMLARILELLARHGVQKVFVSVHYLGERIREYLGDGSGFGVDVEYLCEDRPLDTGAGLALVPRLDVPFLVVNGDVLTNANLAALARSHVLRGALATVATYLYPAALPYGVVHRDGERIVEIEEKPVLRYPVNAGIYAFAPQVLDLVPRGEPLPMVPFLNEQIRAGRRVCRFPLVEYWNDVGSPADFERAQGDVTSLEGV